MKNNLNKKIEQFSRVTNVKHLQSNKTLSLLTLIYDTILLSLS